MMLFYNLHYLILFFKALMFLPLWIAETLHLSWRPEFCHKTDHCPSHHRKQLSYDYFRCSISRQLNIAVSWVSLFTRETYSQFRNPVSSNGKMTWRKTGKSKNRSWILGSVIRFFSFPFRPGIQPAVNCNYILKATSRSRSRWPRRLRRRSAAACLLGCWLKISPETWMPVCCECCVLLGRDRFVGLILRPGESYRVWGVQHLQ